MFVDAFSRHAPEKPALYFPDSRPEVVSFGELEGMVASVSSQLFSKGIRSGQVVAIDIADDFLHAVVLLTCARARVCTIAGRAGDLARDIPVAALLSDRPPGPASTIPELKVDASWLTSPAGTYEFRTPQPDDLCRIMLTSGSTGVPKGVALTYAMIEDRMVAYGHAFGPEFPRYHRVMCSMKLASSLGFGFLFHAIMRGDLFCPDSSDFERITETIRQRQIEVLIAAPYILTELMAYCEASKRSFPRVPLAMTAGSLVVPALSSEVVRQISEKLVIFYGTTETGVIASTSASAEPGDVGAVVEGRRVEVTALDGGPAKPGEAGIVKVSSSAGPLPFFEIADLATRSPRMSFSPGDIGFVSPSGHVVLRGRSDDLINAGGTKITPEQLEQALASAPGIKDCAVLRERDPLGIDRIVAFLALNAFWNQDAFLGYCESHIVRELLPSKFVVVQQIPRNQNQKIDRKALVALATS